MVRLSIIASVLMFLLGCSSIKSVQKPDSSNSDGLTYFLPKKDFLVTVAIKKEGSNTVLDKLALGTTPSYPDLSTQYVLKHGTNLFGKNTLDVGVNEKGLLSSTKSTTTSSVSDVFKNLASTIGNESLPFFHQVPTMIGGALPWIVRDERNLVGPDPADEFH